MHHNKLNHYDCIFKALTSECTAVPALKSECTRPIELQSLHKLEWLQLILMEGASEATILRRVAAIIHHNCANICRNGWYQLIVYVWMPDIKVLNGVVTEKRERKCGEVQGFVRVRSNF